MPAFIRPNSYFSVASSSIYILWLVAVQSLMVDLCILLGGEKLGLEFLEMKSLTFFVTVDVRRSDGFLDPKFCRGFL